MIKSFSESLTLVTHHCDAILYQDYDLRQEQINKSSLLSSEKFLDGLLDMWTQLVVRIGITTI